METTEFKCQMTIYKRGQKYPSTKPVNGRTIQEIVDDKIRRLDQYKNDPDVEVITLGDIVKKTTEVLFDTHEILKIGETVTNQYLNPEITKKLNNGES